MRIVGGTHKGRQLRVPAGDTVRPTTDRVREALFSMLNSGRYGRRIQQAHVLDAYAGSGAMGIEALSRGAEHATFFDNAGPSIAAIQANLEVLDLKSNARVIRTDVARPPKATRSCDIVFLDPPYRDASAVGALTVLATAGWIGSETLVVFEHQANVDLAVTASFELFETRAYGRTRISLLQFAPAESRHDAS